MTVPLSGKVIAAAGPAAIALSLCSAGCGRSAYVLQDVGEPFGVCRNPSPVASDLVNSRAVIQTEPTIIWLDTLIVSGDDPVTVEKVELFGGNGRLRLVSAAFAPGADVGLFGLPREDTGHLPLGYRNRLSVPGAMLTRRTPIGSVAPDNPKPNTWQVVVSVLPLDDYATADGVRVRFRVGDRTGTLTGKDYLGLSRDAAGCEANSRRPHPT
jgi:hypothetical protein